jgi:hypothetical protein
VYNVLRGPIGASVMSRINLADDGKENLLRRS